MDVEQANGASQGESLNTKGSGGHVAVDEGKDFNVCLNISSIEMETPEFMLITYTYFD